MLMLISSVLITLVFIHIYVSYRNECDDKMNRTLFDVSLKVCVWNLLHVAAFFIICQVYTPVSLFHHIAIVFIGVAWFLIESFFGKPTLVIANEKECDKDIVYSNTSKPRYDDFVFNSLGQILYILSRMPL